MNSGIYKLTFSSGKFYIGKSVDVPTRWKQHFDKFQKGKAANLMQAEYDKYGAPSTEVLVYCHADHIDILECYIIKLYPRHLMLNTTFADCISDNEFNTLEKNPSLLHKSTVEHVSMINDLTAQTTSLRDEIVRLKTHIENLKNHGVVMPDYITSLEAKLAMPWCRRFFSALKF